MNLIRIVVGFCVTYFILCIIAGGVKMAAQSLELLIVCTLGGALLALIPMWWIVGCVTLMFVSVFTSEVSRAKTESEALGGPVPAVGGANLALEAYLRKAVTKGMDEGNVTDRLLNLGWSMAEILKARQNIRSATSMANKK